MSQDDFQYRPVNPQRRPRKKLIDLSKLPKLPNFKKGDKWDVKQILLWCAIGFAGLIVAGIILLFIFIAILSIGLPDVKDLDKLAVAQSTTIYDREGNILYVKHGGENRQYIPIDQMSENIINATVAMEDDQFWTHSGFDPMGIARAVFGQITNTPTGGGSTITQQYVKNAFLSPEQTYTRKLKELILSVRLEQEFEKEKILELYLNKIPYGNNAYGIEKAAQIYFGKSASELTLPEAAILASLPQAPSYYNPYGQHRYSELTRTFDEGEAAARNIQSESDLRDNEFMRGLIGQDVALDPEHSVYIQGRTDLVIRAMERTGYITEQEGEDALEALQSIEFKKYQEKIAAPHFVFYIIDQLEEEYGQEIVEQGGLNVYTTIDPKLQEYAVAAVEEGAARNTEGYNVKNGALVALDPTTGEILAMVGSKDYFSDEIDGAVNIITQYRQPGSSFKPIVFAQSFYNRYAPASVIFDVRTRFGSSSFPDNYDGQFMGPISIRTALAQSRNIPAIKAYFLAGGQEPIIELAERMGIQFLDTERDYGWPLALGTAEVRPLDIASAFGVFANNGVRHEPSSILRVENSSGEVLDEWQPQEGEEVLDPQIAYLISDILADQEAGLGGNLQVTGRTVAAKTGTSNVDIGNNNIRPRDMWTIGYTPNLVTAVWTGNNDADDGTPSATASGFTNAAPIWKSFMTQALAELPSEDFTAPEGITTESVSKLTGKLPGPDTPEDQIVEEIFASFSVPTEIDDTVTLTRIDTRNMKLANEYCPPKYVEDVSFISLQAIDPSNESWQEGVDKWLEENSQSFFSGEEEVVSDIIYGRPPSEESELCSEKNLEDAPEITIREPDNNDRIESGSNLEVTVRVQADNGVEKVEYYFDDQLKYSTDDRPYSGTIRLPKGESGTNKHTITVRVIDDFGYMAEDSITIRTSPNGSSSNNNDNDDEEKMKEEEDLLPEPPPEPDEDDESLVDDILGDIPTSPSPADLATI